MSPAKLADEIMQKRLKILLSCIVFLSAAAIVYFISAGENNSSNGASNTSNTSNTKSTAAPYLFRGSESESSRAALAHLLPAVQKFTDRKYDDGLIVAAVTPDGVSTAALGSLQNLPSYQDAYIEIGSVTKAFVGLALASMVNEGIVTAETSLRGCMPQGLSIPSAENITLGMLASHTSGLPRLPDAILKALQDNNPAMLADPYSKFSTEDVWESLKTAEIKAPGTFEYSNLGAAVLAQALTVCAGENSWESLIETRVTKALGLEGIRVHSPTPLIQGHDAQLNPVSEWHWQGMGPTGALKANIMQMAKLAQMMISGDEFTGKEMILTSETPLFHLSAEAEAQNIFSGIAMHWHLGIGMMNKIFAREETKAGMDQLVWHNGETAGASSCIAVIPQKQIGIVVLSNTASGNPYTMALLGLGSILGEPPERIEKIADHLARPR